VKFIAVLGEIFFRVSEPVLQRSTVFSEQICLTTSYEMPKPRMRSTTG